MAIGIPKMPSMAKQSKISHGKLFRIFLSTCSWLKLCFVISQAYRTRPRTIKSMTCRIPYSVKCTSNEFITCFSPIHKIVSQNFAFHFLEGCKMPFSVMINNYIDIFHLNRKLLSCKNKAKKFLWKNICRFRNRENMWWAWPSLHPVWVKFLVLCPAWSIWTIIGPVEIKEMRDLPLIS